MVANAQTAPVQAQPAQSKARALSREHRGEELAIVMHDLWTPGYSLLSVPRHLLVDQDMKARYVKLKNPWRFALIPIGAAIVSGLAFVVGVFLVAFGVMDSYQIPVVIGLLCGFLLGLYVVFRMRSRVIWVFRLVREVDKKTGEITETLLPVIPRPLLQDFRVEASGQKLPLVMRASYVGKMVLQSDVRRFVRSKSGKHKLMQIGAILLFAIALVAILVFTFIATSDSKNPPAEPTSGRSHVTQER